MLKNVKVFRPTIFYEIISREIFLNPSYCRENNYSYSSSISMDYLIINHKTSVIYKRLNFNGFPIMINSNRCCSCNTAIELRTNLKEDYFDPGGYFIINGVERVLRTTQALKQNKILYIVQKWGIEEKCHKMLGILKIVNIDNNYKIIKIKLSIDNNVFIKFKINNREIEILVDLLIMANYNRMNEIISLKINCLKKSYCNVGFKDKVRILEITLIKFLININKLKINQREESISYMGALAYRFTQQEYYLQFLDFGYRFLKDHFGYNSLYNKYGLFFLNISLFKFTDTEKLDKIDNFNSLNNLEITLPADLLYITMKSSITNEINKIKKKISKIVSEEAILSLKREFSGYIKHIVKFKSLNSKIKSLISIGSITVKSASVLESFGNSVMIDRVNYLNFISNFDLVHRGMYFRKLKAAQPRKQRIDSIGLICPVHTPDGTSSGLINHFSQNSLITMSDTLNLISNGNLYYEIIVSINIILPNKDLFLSLSNNKYALIIENCTMTVFFRTNCHYLVLRYLHYNKRIIANKSINLKHVDIMKRKIGNIHLSEIVISIENNIGSTIKMEYNSMDQRIMKMFKYSNSCYYGFLGVFEIRKLQVAIGLNFHNILNISKYSHIEYKELNLLSFVASLVPFSNQNQSPRNMYQCQMSKQSIGIPLNNYLFRRNSKLVYLVHPQHPLCSTSNYDKYSINYFPYGSNAVISIGSISGFNMEDACIMNKKSADLGIFYSILIKSYDNMSNCDNNTFININNIENIKELAIIRENLKESNKNAMCGYNQPFYRFFTDYIETKSIDAQFIKNMINTVKSVNFFDDNFSINKLSSSQFAKFQEQKEAGYNNSYINTFRRKSQVGDKIASRHGQKSVISILMQNESMPYFKKYGFSPDLILNPHSFPSRMTIGMLKETLISKGISILGNHCFKGLKYSKWKYDPYWYCDYTNLDDNDYRSCYGYDQLIYGISGVEIRTPIYSGVVFYMKLIQMVRDKLQFRNSGSLNINTGQPIKGRRFGGGIKIGEMERDAILVYGAQNIIIDRFLKSSDLELFFLCKKCGSITNTNKLECKVKSANCKDNGTGIFIKNVRCCKNNKVNILGIPKILLYLQSELMKFNIIFNQSYG
uniref:DNA-directed RNA polymerase n=1 Tax=Amorphochlora amoebiformis TaxID=1561963 RepID=A0A7S0GPQ0_9EUKA|mmetsp:Transcript_12961/g.20546  ORF Transcript_12961/g.20546 Transcript_12961/m.20546 type:complete len:1113 (+) Transcript_12961:102-3440(+)